MSTIVREDNMYGVFYKDGDKWMGPYFGDLFNKKDLDKALSDASKDLKKKVYSLKLAWIKETKPRNPFTKFYKDIAGCQSPKATDGLGNRFYTNAQIAKAKQLMVGKYWNQYPELYEFAACNSKGIRRFFEYKYTLKEIRNRERGSSPEDKKRSLKRYYDAKAKAKAWSEK